MSGFVEEEDVREDKVIYEGTLTVKGGRKFFFEQAETDMLLSMLLSLMAEHSSVKDRLVKLESFLSDKGLLDDEELASFTPTTKHPPRWILNV